MLNVSLILILALNINIKLSLTYHKSSNGNEVSNTSWGFEKICCKYKQCVEYMLDFGQLKCSTATDTEYRLQLNILGNLNL